MKLAVKINLLFTGIVTCILLGIAILIFNLSSVSVRKDFRERIRSRAARTAYLYDLFKKDTTNFLKSLDASSPPVLYNRYIAIYDTNFTELYRFHDPDAVNIQLDSSWLVKAKQVGEYFTSSGKQDVGAFYSERSLLVLVAAEDSSGKAYINDLKRSFLFYIPVAVIATLLAGHIFSRSIVRPVRQTIHDVKLITSQNLSHRLVAGDSKDELSQLNETFNALLDRLEESFAMEKRFISNASHELSTPLTSISSQVEVALLQRRNPEEYEIVLASVLKDVQDLQQLTRNLLEIAKAGTNGAISLEKLRIDEVLVKTYSDVLQQNPGYKVELAFADLPEDESECMVFGNIHLLNSAFKNIIENGCKYSPDSRTKVELTFNGNETTVQVNNKSVFLPSEEIERLFEPFYRGSNTNERPGFGLGLTLTRRIIAIHKGVLTIHSEPTGGTSVRVILPTLKR